MRKVSSSKVVLALVLLLVNTGPGCTRRDNGTSPAAREVRDERSGLRVLPADSQEALLENILTDRRVESCRRMFESRMLGRRPVSSFTVEGRNADGVLATVTVMFFVGQDSTATGVLAFLEGNGRSRVCAGVARTADGSAFSEVAPMTLTDYAVTNDGRVVPFESVSADSVRGGDDGFWNCVGIGSVGGAAVCAAKCLPAGPLYAECLVACAGWAVLAALVSCAFAELLGAGD